jgi:methylated-DNA-[protein]-cysteine S-methyltransferase
MVLRVCRAVVGPDLAEDAWSETFLAALRAFPSLQADANVEAWLVTIAHRKAIDFDLPLDLQLATGFRRQVLEGLRDVAYGATASYATVARSVGNPRAVRAVGTACATNPLPLVVPCHRVVRSDGRLGAYLGGADVKRTLLQLEGADRR